MNCNKHTLRVPALCQSLFWKPFNVQQILLGSFLITILCMGISAELVTWAESSVRLARLGVCQGTRLGVLVWNLKAEEGNQLSTLLAIAVWWAMLFAISIHNDIAMSLLGSKICIWDTSSHCRGFRAPACLYMPKAYDASTLNIFMADASLIRLMHENLSGIISSYCTELIPAMVTSS